MERRDLATTQDLADLQSALMERFERIDQRFERIDQRFERIDQRFEQIDQRFEQIDQRFAYIDQRLGGTDERLDHVADRLGPLEELPQELRQLGEQLRNLDTQFRVHAAVMEQRFETMSVEIRRSTSELQATDEGGAATRGDRADQAGGVRDARQHRCLRRGGRCGGIGRGVANGWSGGGPRTSRSPCDGSDASCSPRCSAARPSSPGCTSSCSEDQRAPVGAPSPPWLMC